MKRPAAVLLGLVLVSVPVSASEYDLYIYDEFESATYDSSEYAGNVMEEVLYWNEGPTEETVIISVEEDPLDPDVSGLGWYIEIWVDAALVAADQDFGNVYYYQAVPAGSTVQAYMWPVSEWTVSTVDYGDDFYDGQWDGFDITIIVEGVTVFTESEYGEVDYTIEVLYGDEIDVELVSAVDDYDIDLYDEYGDLVEYSNVEAPYEPDWILAEVGGVSSGGRSQGGGGAPVVLLCAPGVGGGSLLGLIFPALVGLLGLWRLRGLSTLRGLTRRAAPERG